MKTLLAALAGLGFVLAAASAQATLIFDFSWSSAGATPDIAGSSSSAIGTLTINKLPGQAFTNGDVSAVNVTLTTLGPSAGVANLTVSNFNAGMIAADGLSATFTNFGFDQLGTSQFFCPSVNCGGGVIITRTPAGGIVNYIFGSPASALASLVATRVPEPGTLALFGLGLAGLCLARRKKTA